MEIRDGKHASAPRLPILFGCQTEDGFCRQSGHFGGGASMAEILSVLYFGEFLNYRPREPKWLLRDIVITEGHLSAAFTASCGLPVMTFPKRRWRHGARLSVQAQGHIEDGVSGVEYTAGPLGKTLSYGVGEAWYAKQKGHHGVCS